MSENEPPTNNGVLSKFQRNSAQHFAVAERMYTGPIAAWLVARSGYSLFFCAFHAFDAVGSNMSAIHKH